MILPGEIVVDNFAGGGGASTGIERALGRAIDIAVNHDADAIRMHMVNHPRTKHLREDVWKVDPMVECAGRPVGLAWFSPDCFPAGTLVLTDCGYRPIEEIQIGDMVLTHKLRWRRVTETHSSRRPLLVLRGHGHPGLTVSPEHPFLARQRSTSWDNNLRRYVHALNPPDWVPASGLDRGWYWGTPRKFPTLPIPKVGGRGMRISEEFMWLVGRYLGDGWTRLTDTRAELVITCGKHESHELWGELNQWPADIERAGYNQLSWHKRDTGTAHQITTDHRGLVEWLRRHFGHRAESKGIPAWALGMPAELRSALLEGYLSADGWDHEAFRECRTVSKALAFGIKALANSLGKTVTIYLRSNSNVIEGREVNARPIYFLRWRNDVVADHEQTTVEDEIEWTPIRENTDTGDMADVFNIGVEEDESFIAEGIIVHNCKHFSKAKGTKPVSKKIRGLAWVVLRWAATVKPRIIMLENVEEFTTWGPLVEKTDGKSYPDPKRKGKTFKAFLRELRKLGYVIDHKLLRACDYGDPTIRKRLFLIARCDGQPIVWPEPTHGDPKSEAVKSGRLLPWRTAAECIQWDIPAPSIFERKKALAEATLRRIHKGINRYVVDAAEPFIVTYYGDKGGEFRGQGMDEPLRTQTTENRHSLVMPFMARTDMHKSNSRCVYDAKDPLRTITSTGGHALVVTYITEHANASSPRSMPIDEPLRTICAQTKGGHFALVAPHMIPLTHQGGDRTNDIKEPFPTITGAHRGEIALVSPTLRPISVAKISCNCGADYYGHLDTPCPACGEIASGHVTYLAPTLIQTGYGEREGQSPRAPGLDKPLGTVVAGGTKHALVAATIVKNNHGSKPCQEVDEPLHTVTTQTNKHALVSAFLAKHYTGVVGSQMEMPIGTITSCDHHSLVAAHIVRNMGTSSAYGADEPARTATQRDKDSLVTSHLVKLKGDNIGQDVRTPLQTITAGGYHFGEVRAFLLQYHAASETHDLRKPINTISTKDRFGLVKVHGEDYQIVDIGLRMLAPRELFRAQGFYDSYIIDHDIEGRPFTKTAQVKLCGNSVCPGMAAALVGANTARPVEVPA